MAIFSKETALEVAYIGAGAVAGKFVGNKAVAMLPSTVTEKLPFSSTYVEGAIPVAVGLFLPSLAGRSTLVRGLANGMIASGASTIVGELIGDVQGAGVGNVMMGNVMMGKTSDSVLMNGTDYAGEGVDSYSDTSYDFTSADAGEMDF
jgi:hypothetical protein